MANWYEEFINDITRERDEYFLMLTVTENAHSPILYEVIDGEVKHCNQLNRKLTDKYFDDFQTITKPGVHIFRYQDHILSEQRVITHYNFELFNNNLCELLLFQEYGLYPVGDRSKAELQESIKAEKIKETLVYACYLNDTEKIMACLEKAKRSQLNKKMQYYGTPLGICAKNNNVEAFKAIVEKGADLDKVSLADRPLKIAFRYSPDIVFYIYENYREQFMKEIAKEGFSIACHTTDVRLLQLLKDHGCDMNCDRKQFPPLLNFADYNNVVGIRFLAEHGANLHVVNNYKQTALDRAKERQHEEAIQLLKELLGE